jgi:DNA gyrase/topoisomerase IV subunit A
MDTVGHDQRRLALLELVQAAHERRLEVIDVVWAAADREEAAERLSELFDVENGADPRVILDMQMERLTKEARDELAAEVARLRNVLGHV